MSPGISLLAARGVQDKWIMLEKGDDKGISFFNQVFKKHSGFSQTVEKQYMQGAPKANSHSRITVTKNGDMLGHVYLTVDDGAGGPCVGKGGLICVFFPAFGGLGGGGGTWRQGQMAADEEHDIGVAGEKSSNGGRGGGKGR